jgi:hypothetical protein
LRLNKNETDEKSNPQADFAAFGPGGPQPRAAGHALSAIPSLSLFFDWVEDLQVRIPFWRLRLNKNGIHKSLACN